jgi:DNA replication protein
MPLEQIGFIGFPDQKLRPVKVPDIFFTDLLPLIDDLAELKLTLHAFWLLNTQDAEVRFLRGDDLRADDLLLLSLNLDSELRTPLEALDDALERAVARNTLIRLDVEVAARRNGKGAGAPIWQDWYFLNTVKGRQAAAQIRTGKLHDLHAVVPEEARLKVERPNIFVLYEQNIGMLTPLLADQLRALEKSYPPDWIAEGFDIAVAANKRALRYIKAILKRWETEGKDSSEILERDTLESRKRKYGRGDLGAGNGPGDVDLG